MFTKAQHQWGLKLWSENIVLYVSPTTHQNQNISGAIYNLETMLSWILHLQSTAEFFICDLHWTCNLLTAVWDKRISLVMSHQTNFEASRHALNNWPPFCLEVSFFYTSYSMVTNEQDLNLLSDAWCNNYLFWMSLCRGFKFCLSQRNVYMLTAMQETTCLKTFPKAPNNTLSLESVTIIQSNFPWPLLKKETSNKEKKFWTKIN